MWNFLMLGLIPGTNIQIGLLAWAISLAVLLVFYCVVWRERRKQTLRFLVIRLSLAISLYRQTKSAAQD